MRLTIKIAVIASMCLLSCKKFVDPGMPANQLASATVFSSDATATAALLSAYAHLEGNVILANLVSYTGLSSDEFALNSTASAFIELHTNNITASNGFSDGFWAKFYQLIYQVNSVLEGVASSPGISNAVKKQLEGEAKFLRAYSYFYLINIYGPVPLITKKSYELNTSVKRTTYSQLYDFIIEELQQSAVLLPDEYKSPSNSTTTERTRANRSTALALLSKVYLYLKDWQKAESFADSVLSKTSLYSLLADPSIVFLKNSKEQIFQVQPVLPNFNTYTGYQMILNGVPSNVYLDKRVVARFQTGDKRRTNWIGTFRTATDSFHFVYKYRVGVNAPSITEYTSVLRLAEIILIKSEALAMQNKLVAAEHELNKIRGRAGLSAISGLSQSQLVDSIQIERLRELFGENANRWFDLKRTGTADAILGVIKGNNWAPTDALYPIPQTELLRNSMLEQNPGY